MYIIFVGIAFVNIYGFFLLGYDKYQAKKEKWRVPEKRFFNLAWWSAGWGILIGMYIWRHKNRKSSFYWKIYAGCLLSVGFWVFFWYFLTPYVSFEWPIG